jgi:hypothetical protein
MMDPPSNYQDQLRRLNRFMAEVLSSHTATRAHQLFPLTERWLQQFGLSSQVASSTILLEAYMRTYREILKGKNIERFPAWFNQKSFEIIREYSGKSKYKKSLEQQFFQQRNQQPESSINPTDTEHPNIGELLRLLEALTGEELEILSLRIVQGLSWSDVREEWIRDGNSEVAAETLRQKGELALNRLRKIFDEAYLSGSFGEDD